MGPTLAHLKFARANGCELKHFLTRIIPFGPRERKRRDKKFYPKDTNVFSSLHLARLMRFSFYPSSFHPHPSHPFLSLP